MLQEDGVSREPWQRDEEGQVSEEVLEFFSVLLASYPLRG